MLKLLFIMDIYYYAFWSDVMEEHYSNIYTLFIKT